MSDAVAAGVGESLNRIQEIAGEDVEVEAGDTQGILALRISPAIYDVAEEIASRGSASTQIVSLSGDTG